MLEQHSQLDPRIRSLLAGLRWRIRAYVCLQGACLALIWLGITFWIGLALDYLPVLAGASEMPQLARGLVLATIAVGLIYILNHWVLRRTIVRLSDRNMAVLLERKFDDFHDSLLTSVELNENTEHAQAYRPEMLLSTSDQARSQTRAIRLRHVFDFAPLSRSVFGAAVLLLTLLAFFAVNRQAMGIWVQRFYLLEDRPWPRNASVEIVGIDLLATDDASPTAVELPTFEFQNGRLKVAKGSNVRLKVRADMNAKVVPEVCTLYYTTEDGERGRVNMNQTRRSVGQYQDYSFAGKPLRGILSTVQFDVIGFDCRVRNYTIEVVDSPVVVDVELDCRFPDYMVDETLSLWLPRTIELTSATRLPRGTEVTIRLETNKPLRRVDLYDPETKASETFDIDSNGSESQSFQYHVAELQDNLALDVILHDVDNVVTERPYRLFIASVPDEEPLVDARLQGIGTAVTPDVRVPVSGVVTDDYAVEKIWFDVEVQRQADEDNLDHQQQRHEIPRLAGGAIEAALDFRQLRSAAEGLELRAQDKLLLVVQASDRYDLGDSPNVGSGDRYQLDVVTPDQLLATLESREIGLRRRFEQIVEEMSQARDFLRRVESPAVGAEPGDANTEPGDEKVDERQAAERTQALRLLRAQQAQQQVRKSAQELLGVATAFRDIREELINNRVDTEDRKKRLKELVADPMETIGQVMFPELDRRIDDLEKTLFNDLNAKEYDLQQGTSEATLSIAQINDIIAELEEILQQMLDLETFSELLDIVRDLLRDQQDLIDETSQERKRGLLLDLQ